MPEVKKVAADMPEGAVSVAGSVEEFVGMVEKVFRSHGTEESLTTDDTDSTDGRRAERRRAISDAVKDQDWGAKVDEILEMVGG